MVKPTKLACRCLFLVGTIAIFYVASPLPDDHVTAITTRLNAAEARSATSHPPHHHHHHHRVEEIGRQLLGSNSTPGPLLTPPGCDCSPKKILTTCLLDCTHGTRPDFLTVEQIRSGGVALYILGSLYMFVALSIVCDDFFVPWLEVIADKANISNDVAGATLMAAGGSAPELFTSFIGTFQQSAVGFGTIVGSAVFNVLFVVAMCALFSNEVLTLTWWPLFRDSVYYSISLVVLALFFAVSSPNQIDWWEALVLFGMYIGYVFMMAHHLRLRACVERCLGLDKTTSPSVSPVEPATGAEAVGDENLPKMVNNFVDSESKDSKAPQEYYHHPTPEVYKASAFRAGLLKMMVGDSSMLDAAAAHVTHRITGSAHETFDKLDTDNSGFLQREEIVVLILGLGTKCNQEQIDTIMTALDTSGDGKVSFEEFNCWYIRSEERIANQLKFHFSKLDTDQSGDLDKSEILTMLKRLHPEERGKMVQHVERLFTELAKQHHEKVFFSDFKEWYFESVLFQDTKATLDKSADSHQNDHQLKFPKDCRARLIYILIAPLTYPLSFSMPPFGGRPGPQWNQLKWGLYGFSVSICWIGLYSWLMVWWVEVAGAAFGIPPVVMGITFLAAGTSVPDLLSSVIVAKMGEGDMAVSSSIGSNIFDVTVGLPLPWLIYSAVYDGASVDVHGESIAISIAILVLMLMLVIGSIMASGWKLTKPLGATMLVFYAIFVAQDLARYDW